MEEIADITHLISRSESLKQMDKYIYKWKWRNELVQYFFHLYRKYSAVYTPLFDQDGKKLDFGKQ